MKCFRGPTAASPARMGWGRRRKERWGKRAAPVRFFIKKIFRWHLLKLSFFGSGAIFIYFLDPVRLFEFFFLLRWHFYLFFYSGSILSLFFFGSGGIFQKNMIIQWFIYQFFLFNIFLEDIYMRKKGWSFCLVIFWEKHWFKQSIWR